MGKDQRDRRHRVADRPLRRAPVHGRTFPATPVREDPGRWRELCEGLLGQKERALASRRETVSGEGASPGDLREIGILEAECGRLRAWLTRAGRPR
jgi:hypothetical protein